MQTREVTGTWELPDGAPASGSVVFTPTARLVDVSTATMILPDSVEVSLVGGTIDVDLPVTDGAGVEPAGWLWEARECLDQVQAPQQQRVFLFALPADAGPLDLSTVIPRSEVFTGPVQAGPQGPKGDPGPQGPKGDVAPLVVHPGENAPGVAGGDAYQMTPNEWVSAVRAQWPSGGIHVYDNALVSVNLTATTTLLEPVVRSGGGEVSFLVDTGKGIWRIKSVSANRALYTSGSGLGGAWGSSAAAMVGGIAPGGLQLLDKATPPAAGHVLTSTDTSGNAVWRPIPSPLPDTSSADPGAVLMLEGPAQGQTVARWSDNLTAALDRIDDADDRLNNLAGFQRPTGNTTLTAADSTVAVDTTGGARVLTLPAASAMTGRSLRIVKTGGANSLTLQRAGGDLIGPGGKTSVVFPSDCARGHLEIVSDGTGWLVLDGQASDESVGSRLYRWSQDAASKSASSSVGWVLTRYDSGARGVEGGIVAPGVTFEGAQNGWTVAPYNAFTVRRIGNIVLLAGTFRKDDYTSGRSNIWQIPAGFRPREHLGGSGPIVANTNAPFGLAKVMTVNGYLTIEDDTVTWASGQSVSVRTSWPTHDPLPTSLPMTAL